MCAINAKRWVSADPAQPNTVELWVRIFQDHAAERDDALCLDENGGGISGIALAFVAAGSRSYGSLEPLERPANSWATGSGLHLAAHSMCKTPGTFNFAPSFPSSMIKMRLV